MRHFSRFLFALVLVATNVAAQTQIASWTVPSDGTLAVGQAQDGAVYVTASTLNMATRYLPDGTGTNGTSYGVGLSPFAVENTDHRLVLCDKFSSSVLLFSAGSLLARFVYPDVGGNARCYPFDAVPIEGGKVLVAVTCPGQGSFFHVFDRNLALVDSFPVRPDADVVGVTRRPGGSLVVCTRNEGNFAPTKLTAYTSSGSVLWDVVVGGLGGAVASDARGAIYLCQPGGSGAAANIFVYSPDGALDHVWSGPPGSPFVGVKDIASSLDGTVLYALDGSTTVRSFGSLPTPVHSMSWGRVKQHYR